MQVETSFYPPLHGNHGMLNEACTEVLKAEAVLGRAGLNSTEIFELVVNLRHDLETQASLHLQPLTKAISGLSEYIFSAAPFIDFDDGTGRSQTPGFQVMYRKALETAFDILHNLRSKIVAKVAADYALIHEPLFRDFTEQGFIYLGRVPPLPKEGRIEWFDTWMIDNGVEVTLFRAGDFLDVARVVWLTDELDIACRRTDNGPLSRLEGYHPKWLSVVRLAQRKGLLPRAHLTATAGEPV